MADLYQDPTKITLTANQGKFAPNEQQEEGGNDFNKYLASLSPEDRKAALDDVTKPVTGEEIAQQMAEADQKGEIYDPNYDDWVKLNSYQKTKESDLLGTLFNGMSGIANEFQQAGSYIINHPLDSTVKLPANVVESFAQSSRMLYGILGQSQDSTSPQARFFNWINGRSEDSMGAYNAFLDARNFTRDSNALARGEKTMVMDKDLINHEIVQVGQYIADPTWFIPLLKGAVGLGHVSILGEKALAASARVSALRDAVIGGSIKWGVGAPIEFLGKATRGTIDYGIENAAGAFHVATGMSANEAAGAIRMSGVGFAGAGAFGHAVPFASEISGAYVAGRAASGVGEAIGMVGNQIMKGERGILSYASQAIKDTEDMGIVLNPHTKSLLKVINAFDPVLTYAGGMMEGAIIGGGIGGALGAWSGGEEGMAGGIGAGIALGAFGAGTGKFVSDISGKTRLERQAVTAQMVLNGLQETNPNQYAQWNALRVIGQKTGVNYDGVIGALDRLAPKAELFFRSNADHEAYLVSKGLDPNTYKGDVFLPNGDRPLSKDQFSRTQGFVIEKKATGETQIHINLDEMTNNTVGHELFHAIMRTTVLKDSYVQMLKDHIIGSRDLNGNVVNSPSVAPTEAKQMFRRYIDAEYRKGTAEHTDAVNRLDSSIRMFEKDGTLAPDAELGRPYLEHLSEEFGAYYFTHWLKSKPIDYLFYETNLPGIRGVFDKVKNSWLDYWQNRMESSDPTFNFNRKYYDSASGEYKKVPINEVFSPVGTGRVRVSALDYFMKDFIQATMATNRQNAFDINSFGRESQGRFIRGQGLDGVFTKKEDGTYRFTTENEIKRENGIKGKAVYKILKAMKPEDRSSVIDAEGNITGTLSEKELSAVVQSGHMSQELANKIRLAQSIVLNKNIGNVIDFGGIGKTAEKGMAGEGRLYGSKVPFKVRTGILFGLQIKISESGEFSFRANMLDQKVIEQRANNVWQNPEVQKLWVGNHSDFMTDFYRYLENASKNPNDPKSGRVQSSELWTDGQGAERRNALHQVLGLAKSDGDIFLNAPTAEIPRGVMSSVFDFNLNRMTNLRVRDTRVPYVHENAYKDLVRNWQPAEMDSERTASGSIFKHVSGYKFIYNSVTNRTDAYDETGTKIGTYDSKELAVKAGQDDARKHSGVLTKNYMPVDEAAGEGGRSYDKKSRQWNFGFIGKQAELNPSVLNGVSLRFVESPMTDIKGNKFMAYRVSIHDNQGIEIGRMNASTKNNGRQSMVSISVDGAYRNRGYGKIIMSEMAERLRAEKVEEMGGFILNTQGLPVKMREAVIGDVFMNDSGEKITQKEIVDLIQQKTQDSGWASGVKVYNRLEQSKHYQPVEENAGEAGQTKGVVGEKGLSPETTFTPLKSSQIPDPDKHTLWQFLRWHKDNKGDEIPFTKALEFLAKKKDLRSSAGAEWLLTMIEGVPELEKLKLKLSGNNISSKAKVDNGTTFLNINPESRGRKGEVDNYNEPVGSTISEILDRAKDEHNSESIYWANNGRGFEGTMLEEMMHAVQFKIFDEVKSDPQVKALFYQGAEGNNWARLARDYVKGIETDLTDGKEVHKKKVILAKILKLHEYTLKNIRVKTKGGTIETLYSNISDAFARRGKNKKQRLDQGTSYVDKTPSMSNTGYEYAKGSYRYQNLAEFLIAPFNDVVTMEQMSRIKPVDFGILDAGKHKTFDGLLPNAKNLFEQFSALMADFFGWKRGDKSAATQLMDLVHNLQERSRFSNDVKQVDMGVPDEPPSNKPSKVTEQEVTETPEERAKNQEAQMNSSSEYGINNKKQRYRIAWMDRMGNIVPRESKTGKPTVFDPKEHRVVLMAMVHGHHGWQVNHSVVPHVMELGTPESEYANYEFKGTHVNKGKKFTWWDAERQQPKSPEALDYDYHVDDKTKAQTDELVTQKAGISLREQGYTLGEGQGYGARDRVQGVLIPPEKPVELVDPNRVRTGLVNEDNPDVPVDPNKPNQPYTPVDRPNTPTDEQPVPPNTPPNTPPTNKPIPNKPPVTMPPPKGKQTASSKGTAQPSMTPNDVRMWRSWTSNTNPNGKTWANGMGFVIVQQLTGKYRLYNPMKALIGVFNTQDDAQKKVMKLEPR